MASLLNPETANGFALLSLSRMVAECEELQDELQVASAEDALPFVAVPAWFPPDQQINKAFACIYEKSYDEGDLADGCVSRSGELFLMLGKTVEVFADRQDEDIEFANFAGKIRKRVLELSRDGTGRLHITGIGTNVPPMRSVDEQVAAYGAQHPFYIAEYIVSWNPIG